MTKPETRGLEPTAVPRTARPLLLDGGRLAEARLPLLRARAAAVAAAWGRAPRLALVAFGDAHGRARHLARKVHACRAAGVEALPCVVRPGATTADARAAMLAHLESSGADGLFLQFPYPPGVDGDALAAAIPWRVDVDAMTPHRVDRCMAGEGAPPVTVSAALALLDAYGVGVAGRRGAVVAEAHAFAFMFREAFVRAGARMLPLVAPDDGALRTKLGDAALVIVAAGRSGLVTSASLAPGAVAIDAGYFNPGGRGDIDTSTGTAHLDALCAVPGGIGPMTVSCLIERVIQFAEEGAG